MLIYSLFTVLAAVALPSVLATPALLTRTVSLCLLCSAILAMNALSGLAIGDSLYNGLLSVTPVAIALMLVLLFGGVVALQPWAPQNSAGSVTLPCTAIPTVATYPLFVLFTLIGGTVLMVTGDLITLYLAVELQSFALYIIASVISRDSETSTNSGLLYFLLGGLSSSIILLGSALLYSATGSTNLEAILSLLQVTDEITIQGFGPSALGFTLVGIGFLFKVTAAPFHHWGPDVYDGVPTIVATWLAVLPKISIFSLIVILQTNLGDGILQVNIVNYTYDA